MEDNMLKIDPKETPLGKLHGLLLGAIAPRPIAFASTIDKNGNVNLSPFSFFNVFSANPPIAIFSPARRGRDNTTKHTYENVKQVPEVVINVVSYNMVQQMSLSSTEYEKGVNEFKKAGFNELTSEKIRPPRVKEAPVQMECKVKEVIELGTEGGSGNLIVCEVILMHVNESILDEAGVIDPQKIDLVGRMGGNWYSRASGKGIFEVEKPLVKRGIGVDQIPEDIRLSNILTGNHLGQLGNVEILPDETEVNEYKLLELSDLFQEHDGNKAELEKQLHLRAQLLLEQKNVQDAWKTLLAFND